MRRDDNNVAKEVITTKGEETSRKAQTEVDGQSAERSEKTSARTIARKEQRSLEKWRHGDRSRTGIGSAKVSKGEHDNAVRIQAVLTSRHYSIR